MRTSYTPEIKARSAWVTEHFSRTGPDVIFAVDTATVKLLKARNLDLTAENLGNLAASKDHAADREEIRVRAAGTCKYVGKVHVARCLEAHAVQLAAVAAVPAPAPAPAP